MTLPLPDQETTKWLASFLGLAAHQVYMHFKMAQGVKRIAGAKTASINNGDRIASLHEKVDDIRVTLDGLGCRL